MPHDHWKWKFLKNVNWSLSKFTHHNNIETEFSSYSVYSASTIVIKQVAKMMLLRNKLSCVDCIYVADIVLKVAFRIAAEENILQSHTEIRLLNCENIPVVKVFFMSSLTC